MRKSKYDLADTDLSVKRSRAGLGLFTNAPIPRGACIIEYVGERISEEESNRRDNMYIFEVNKHEFVDGATRKNTARYINHSCRPNCEIDIYRKHIYVMAKRNIKAGEELGYDYQSEFFDEFIKPKGCRCLKCMPEEKAK
jgi:SET domain-containing protein